MSAASTITASASLVSEGTPVTIYLVFSGVSGHPTITNVGWLGRPPYWTNADNMINSDPTTNAGFFSFIVVLESAGNAYDAGGKLVTQPIMPYFTLSDGSVVVPASNSSAPPVNPAYPSGKNPTVISVIPTPVGSVASSSASSQPGAPGTLDFSNSANSALLAVI